MGLDPGPLLTEKFWGMGIMEVGSRGQAVCAGHAYRAVSKLVALAPGLPVSDWFLPCDPCCTGDLRAPYQTFYGQSVWLGEAPPCSPPRIEFHFPPAPSISLPQPPSTHLHHQTGLSLTSKQGTLIKETVTPFMSLVELGFRDLVTSGSHNANKSLPAPRGVGLLGTHCKQGHRVGMGAQHKERETSPVRNPSDSVGEVVT